MALSFKLSSAAEHSLIDQIAVRAMEVARQADVPLDRMTITMDVTACHLNSYPLRLADLLTAKAGDFSHDVFGIHRHINRETGELENCFVPRYAA